MDDIIHKLSSNDPRFTYLDLRDIDIDQEELTAIAEKLEKNTLVNRVSWKNGYRYDTALKKRIEDKIKLNNQTFQRYPNDFILGLFSCHAYTDSEKDASVKFSPKPGVAKADAWNEALEGWNVFKIFDNPESGGYYSVAYMNNSKKQIALAHRGTKLKFRDLAKRESPLKTDLEGILGGKIVKQQEAAYDATKKVVKHAKEEGYNVVFTGHSLGAWLAELSVFFAVNDFDFQCKAVTFDSPGSASTMESFKPNVKSHGNNPIIKNLDITTYLSAPNLVNCCNAHIGKVYQIFPEITWIKNTDRLRTIMKKTPIAKHIEPVLASLLSIDGHRIEPIIATFDSSTGKPERFEKVLDWPCFKYQPVTTNTTTGKVLRKTLNSFASLFKYLPGIGWLVYESFTKPTFFTLIKAIDDFVNGNIDSHQFRKVYESSEFIAKGGGEEIIPLTSGEQFLVRYEAHYSTQTFNPAKDHYNPESTDKYLNELCKLSIDEIDKMKIYDDLKQSLKNLKGKYEIKFEAASGRKYICSKSPDIHIDDLRERIVRLCEIYSELKEVFDDKHAFLPQTKPLTQSGMITSNLPLRSNKFLERPAVMKTIGEVLDKHKFVAISAFGGTGKSTMAIEYGRYLRGQISGQVVQFIEADSSDKVRKAYKMIATTDLELDITDGTASIMQAVHSRIANSGCSVLFIFDNVERYEDIQAYLDGISNLEAAKVIITTRHNDLSEDLQTINLEPFTREEAKSYLLNTMPDRFSSEDLEKLLNNLASPRFYLPFNISHAVEHFKKNPLYKIERCIEDLAESNGETGTFLLLDLINTSELSWLVLQYSAYLDPDFINIDIFKELLSVDEDRLQVAIEKLESSGLMSLRRLQNGLCGLKIHRLLQDLVSRFSSENKGSNSIINKPDIFERTLEVLNNLNPIIAEGVIVDRPRDEQIYCISLHEMHTIDHFLRWLCEFDNVTSNTFVFTEKAKQVIDTISNCGTFDKNYVVTSDAIAAGVTGGPRDQRIGVAACLPSDHPPFWFENLQTFINRASCRMGCVQDWSINMGKLGLFKAEYYKQMYQRYPNDFVLGLFSGYAYADSEKGANVEFSLNSGVANSDAWNEDLKNWTVFEVFDDSVAYLNEDKEQMVLAYRGFTPTFFKTSMRKSPSNLKEIHGRIENTADKAKIASEKVIKHAQEKGYSVSFTGHLLGGWLAKVSLFQAWFRFKFILCKAVVFEDPPEFKEWLDRYNEFTVKKHFFGPIWRKREWKNIVKQAHRWW